MVLNSHVTCEECQSQEKDPPVQGGKVDKQCRELGSVVEEYDTYCYTIFSLNIHHYKYSSPARNLSK